MAPENSKFKQLFQILKNKATRIKITPEFARSTDFQRWSIIILLNILLALLITPNIQISQPDYKIGSIATRDVRADRDFLVEDRMAIEQKRIEVIKNIQSVYDYDIDVPLQISGNVVRAFTNAARLYSQPAPALTYEERSTATRKSLPRQVKKSFEDSLGGITITENEFHTLQKYKFSPMISDKITKVVNAVYNSELITNATFQKQDTDNGIVIRDIKTQKEKKDVFVNNIIHISKLYTVIIKKSASMLNSDAQDVKKLVISLTLKTIQPNLTFNRNATERKRQIAVRESKPVYFQVQKDEMIVREGQKITVTDLDKLNAYYTLEGEKLYSNLSILLGIFLIIAAMFVVFFLLTKGSLKSERMIHDILFLSFTISLQIILVKIGIFMSQAINRAFPYLSSEVCFYAIPYTVGAMLVGLLISQNMALIFSIFASFLIAFLFDSKIHIALFAFIGSVVAFNQVVHCKQRSAFFRVGLLLGLVNCGIILSISLIHGNTATLDTVIKFIMGVTGGIFSGIIIAGVTPLVESLFDYTTDIKLLELANLNQPIFQQMIMEAPGTYHHSIVVASLVEAAAEAIGANSLLAKVSAYYHDIGKIKKSQYFIENQRNGENRHDRLSPKMSSLIIITHVKDGYELGDKAGLGRKIKNVIREHHGTSLVSYFYEKSRKDRDPSIRSLPESDFRYPGPKPQSREAGLVLLGDVIEASSRTLSNPTPSRIKSLVRDRIERVFMDGQLDECELTLRDLNKIADSFNRILNGIFHHRIDYPKTVIKDVPGNGKDNNGNTDRKSSEKNKRKPSSVTSDSD
jgi:putative nucleotidyltransferase with HDIG domain